MSLASPTDKGKKVEGKVTLIERSIFDLKSIGTDAIIQTHDYIGQNVEFQLVSATVGDPCNGNRGVLGPAAYLEKRLQSEIQDGIAGESEYGVTFTVIDSHGIPGAIIVTNHHLAEFFLRHITIENFPGKGRIHFECNSWVYNAQKYSYKRIFFTNDPYLPKKTPDPLQGYRADELQNLRGDDVNRKLEEWDRIYGYAFYDDLGNPDRSSSLSRPVLGGSCALPYPRRGKTARPPTKADPLTESPTMPHLENYVPHDERFKHVKALNFLGHTIKTVAGDLLPVLLDALSMTPGEFHSFKEVLALYELGLPLPDIPVVRKFLDNAPCEKFHSIILSIAGKSSLTEPSKDTRSESFKNMLPMLKAILNMRPAEFASFKEVLMLYSAGLPLPDIPLVRRFLEIAPGDMFKSLLMHIAEHDKLRRPSEVEPFKKLEDLVPLLQVILHFTPDELHSFKDSLRCYKDGQPLPNNPMVRRFFEAAPKEAFKVVLSRCNDKDSLFKSPGDAPFEKHFKSLLPMLQVIINFTSDELALFKKVMDSSANGLSLPDIPLVKNFLAAAPSAKFRSVYIPNNDHENWSKLPEAMSWEEFRDLIPTLQVVTSFSPDECNSFKEFLACFKLVPPSSSSPPPPIHSLLRKLLEIPPCEKFRGVIMPVINKDNLFTLPLAAPFVAAIKGLAPILQTITNLMPDEFNKFKDALVHPDSRFSLRDSPLVQRILRIARWDKSKAVLVPADYQSIFRFPEIAPLEKHFIDLLPMLHVTMNLKPVELEPLKKVLHNYECGLPLPDIPMIQKFIGKVPCNKLESVLVPSYNQESFFKTTKIPPLEKLKAMYPMLHALIDFQPNELDSFKKAIDHYISMSRLADIPPIRRFLELAPNKMFAGILENIADKENLFSLPKSAPFERCFNDILPMIRVILSMSADELLTFKQVLERQKEGIPLPCVPLVQRFLGAAPCEKFKPVLIPATSHNSLYKSPETAPMEKRFKEQLPMLHFILNLAPNELTSFWKVLIYYEAGYPLPDVPLIRKFLESIPNQKFKEIPGVKVGTDKLKMPDPKPREMFMDLLPMMWVILNFTTTELDSFKKVLADCDRGLPLPDIPLIRVILEVAPYAKFKSIISSTASGCLFRSPEASPLERYFKTLLPMLHFLVNLTPKESDTFKDVLHSYELGLPLPNIPTVRKFLEVAPCENFKPILMPDVDQGGLLGFSKKATLEKFKVLVPMALFITTLKPNELDKFKEVLKLCEGGSPLQDIPLVRKFLKAAPGGKFKPDFIDRADQGFLFSSPDGMLMEKYFRGILPMLLMITNLKPKDFDLFKEAIGHFEGGHPLPDIPVIRKFLEVAPCERFKSVLMPSADKNNMFKLPNAAQLEKLFKDQLPMLQSIMLLVPEEFNSFKEVVHHYEYGLPLPDIGPARKVLDVPGEKLNTVLKPNEGHQSVHNLPDGAPIEKLRDMLPMLHVIINFGQAELVSFKQVLNQCEKGLPLQDIPVVRKFLEAAPYENLRVILKNNVKQGSLFKLPEATPLEKFFKVLMPMLHIILNMTPKEFESLKNVLHRYEQGLPLPSIPLVQKFIDAVPSEDFKVILMPKVSQVRGLKVAPPVWKFKDMVPMLHVIANFEPNELNTFKRVIDHCIHGSPPPDIPIVRKLLQFSPLEKTKDILAHNVKEGSLFSLPEAAPLEEFFKGLVPMFQVIVNMKHDEFDSFREALDRHRDGLPLPNIPLVKRVINVAPCEKFKPILMPDADHDSVFGFLQAAPSEEYFKSLVPQMQVIFNLKPGELDSFKRLLNCYEFGLPLPNIPLIRKFLEAAPYENFKSIFPPSSLPALPVEAPTEKFQHLFPLLHVITRFTPDELTSFKEVLGQCHGGSPLKDIPPVRRFLEATPYVKFKTILTSSISPGKLFELPEAAPMVKYFKHLLPMLLAITNLTTIDFNSFKEVLDNYEVGLPLPDIPAIRKFLDVAPCEKFRAILLPHFGHDIPLMKFKNLLPILLVLIDLKANELKSFKEVLDCYKGEPPLPNIPLVQKLLEIEPLEKHFKDLLPMFLVIVNLAPNEFDVFKEAFRCHKDRLPLPDLPPIRKILEAAPCEKFRTVLIPSIDQDSLFRLPEAASLEKVFRSMLPIFRTIVNFKPNEFHSFGNVLHHYSCGLPLPNVPMVRKLLKAAPDNKFKAVLEPDLKWCASASFHHAEKLKKPAEPTIKMEQIDYITEVITPHVERSSLFKLPEVPLFDKFKSDAHSVSTCGLLKFPTPKIIQEDKWAWATDEEFARQMVAGINPIFIQRLMEFPPKSKLEPKQFGNQNSTIKPEIIQQNLDGLTVKQALDRNRLYILDHHDTVMPYLSRINSTEHKVYATRTVLFLKKDGTLKPVAIELSVPTQGGSVLSQVYTPSSSGMEGCIWLMAKAHVIVNDSSIHQLISHWLHTHAVVEPFVIATNRQLSVMHPLNKLMVPHFRHTMSINAIYRQVLINAGGILELTSFPGKYAMEMSAAAYNSWNFVEQGLPADLIKRGMAVKDKSFPHNLRLLIQDYPYAADGLEVWSAIETWVRDYCAIYYECEDETVQEDDELQCWWKEIREVGHGDLKDRPWWPKMSSFEDLVQCCTTIIWISSGMHAAVNFGQYHYAGHIPNRPTISRRFIPAPGSPDYEVMKNNPENLFLRTINGMLQTIIGISVMEVQSTHGGDEVYLGQRECTEWTGDPRAIECLNRFCVKLKALERKIEGMNRDPLMKNRTGPAKMTYTLLSPYSNAGITGKGIPNSISI